MADLLFVIYSERKVFGAELRRQLEESGHVRVAAVATDADELGEALGTHRPDGVFADLGLKPHAVIDILDGIPAPRPLLVVCGPQEDSEVILRAMKQGVKEYLPPEPDSETIQQALGRLLLEGPPVQSASTRKAPVVAVMGAKGGVGTTTVACQLAASFQETGARTVIVDLDFPFGDVAVHFDVSPPHSIANLASETETIDRTFLHGLLQPHASGVRILAGPTEVTEAQHIRGAELDRALEILREEFDWVVIDISHSWYEASAHVLDVADQILLITSMDVPTLNRARRHLELMRRLGHSEAGIHVVVNRRVKSNDVSEQDLARFLTLNPDANVPNDFATTSRCVNQGCTVAEIAPEGALHRAYRELARKLYEWNGLEPPKLQSGGLLKRLSGAMRKR